jgi:ATP-binding cassette subfamily F protein 3
MLSTDPCLVDLNALAWLEDYLQTWPGTLVVV